MIHEDLIQMTANGSSISEGHEEGERSSFFYNCPLEPFGTTSIIPDIHMISHPNVSGATLFVVVLFLNALFVFHFIEKIRLQEIEQHS